MDAKDIVKNLESMNIICYPSHSKRFILFEIMNLDNQVVFIEEVGNKIL